MKDPDGDGVYTFGATIPEGNYQFKVALDESWAVSYPADNVLFSVPAGGEDVTFSYDSATNDVAVQVGSGTPPDEELVRPAIQKPIQDEVMYFALTDRMWNADTTNDEGAVPGGTLAETGFLVDDKAFYHGGDLAGMISKLGLPARNGNHLALADAGVQESADPVGWQHRFRHRRFVSRLLDIGLGEH